MFVSACSRRTAHSLTRGRAVRRIENSNGENRVSITSIQFPLNRGERQLWAGLPGQGITFSAADLAVVPFMLMWTGFACFWEYMVIRSHGPLFMKLWGLPFIGIGLYMLVGRFFADAWRRKRTSYAVTSERVIIATTMRSLEMQCIDLRSLGDITLIEKRDGSGTIVFGPAVLAKLNLPVRGVAQVPRLENIPDVRRVYDLLREAQQAARSVA
jgi:hypothetical protein